MRQTVIKKGLVAHAMRGDQIGLELIFTITDGRSVDFYNDLHATALCFGTLELVIAKADDREILL